jgi:hypothetical protein
MLSVLTVMPKTNKNVARLVQAFGDQAAEVALGTDRMLEIVEANNKDPAREKLDLVELRSMVGNRHPEITDVVLWTQKLFPDLLHEKMLHDGRIGYLVYDVISAGCGGLTNAKAKNKYETLKDGSTSKILGVDVVKLDNPSEFASHVKKVIDSGVFQLSITFNKVTLFRQKRLFLKSDR